MYFFWGTNYFLPTALAGGYYIAPPYFGYEPITTDPDTGTPTGFVFSTLQSCQLKNSGKYFFSEVALVQGDGVSIDDMTNLQNYF
jgi:hypothetical protein